MLTRSIVEWVEKKQEKAIEEGSCVKAFAAGFAEGAIDGALVGGLVLAAWGGLLLVHDGLHKWSGK